MCCPTLRNYNLNSVLQISPLKILFQCYQRKINLRAKFSSVNPRSDQNLGQRVVPHFELVIRTWR